MLQATDAARKAEKRRIKRKLIGKETRQKMDARDIAREVDLDDIIEQAKKTAAASSAIAEITCAEASEDRKHVREAAKEVRARAAAFDKHITSECTCSTQPSQRARLLAAIKQDNHLKTINSPKQTSKHLLIPSTHQSNNQINIKQPEPCTTRLNQASFLPNVKNIRASKLHPTEIKQHKVSAYLQQSSACAEEQRVPAARTDTDTETKAVKTVCAETNAGMMKEIVNEGDDIDMTKKSESELSLTDMICKMEKEYSEIV